MKKRTPIARRNFLRTGIGAGGLLMLPVSIRGYQPVDHLPGKTDTMLPRHWRSVVRISRTYGSEFGEASADDSSIRE